MTKKLLLVLSLFLIPLLVFGGTTGKISGMVTDSETGEALPGINIFLENTTMGAATDANGDFVIINIPPGNYSVVASGVGFQKKIFTGVKVSADFTTKLDFKMSTESIEVETVVVRAEAKMVRKDLTSSHTAIDAAQIENLPVENVNQLLMLQAGITVGVGGSIHIRGGRSNEIAYTVNGVSISNPYDYSPSISIATNAIQELSVVSGTFNAEYGNALSGIVNTITKEGGSKYKGSFAFYTGDYISSYDNLFDGINNIDPLNNTVTEMTLGGPIPFLEDKFTFFLSGRYDDDNGYLYGVKQHTIYDSVYKNSLNPNDIRIAANGNGNAAPMDSSHSLSTTFKLTFSPFSTMKINYDVLFSYSNYKPYVHDLKYNPDAVNNYFSTELVNSLELRHAISSSTFYSLRASYNYDDFKRYLFPLLDGNGDEVNFTAGESLDGLHVDPRYQPDFKSTTRAAPVSFSSGGTYQSGGQSHFYQNTVSAGLKFDVTSQFDKQHEVKAGLEFRNHQLDYNYFDILRDTTVYLVPTIAPEASNRNNAYTKEPIEFSAYVQDKMEFEDIVINVGLRYDYFNSNSKYSTNVFYPSPNAPIIPSYINKDELLADADAKQQLSPRVGISFPITDRGIIHFSYGHFFQLPSLAYLYSNSEYEYSFGTPTYGNANLNPEKTVSYELGLQQQLLDNLAFNVTGYYKDVRDLLASQQIRISGDETYITYVNKDYASIKGITFSLTKRRTPEDMLAATLDYTFQIADGNDVDADAFFLDLSSGDQTEKVPVALGWDKNHQLNATVSYGEFNSWNVTLVGRIGTGLPYTPELFGQQVTLEPNSGRRPSQSRVDLLAEKTLNIFDFDVSFFVKVYNLFDQLNENSVYASTGRSNYTLDSVRGSAIETDLIAARIPEVHTSAEVYTRPDFYLPPREVRIGFSIDF
ncbi:MAG: TonB-dependent receptor [Bacteroidota bacterium]